MRKVGWYRQLVVGWWLRTGLATCSITTPKSTTNVLHMECKMQLNSAPPCMLTSNILVKVHMNLFTNANITSHVHVQIFPHWVKVSVHWPTPKTLDVHVGSITLRTILRIMDHTLKFLSVGQSAFDPVRDRCGEWLTLSCSAQRAHYFL